jgi:thioredoxin:protein disulfide reductase
MLESIATRRAAALRALLLALVLPVWSVEIARAATRDSSDVVDIASEVEVTTATPGDRIDFTFVMNVKTGLASKWHVYAHGDTGFVGLEFIPDEDFPLEELTIEYPPGHLAVFFGEQVRIVEGRQRIRLTARIPDSLDKGRHQLQFTARLQACDESICLAPANVSVVAILSVE